MKMFFRVILTLVPALSLCVAQAAARSPLSYEQNSASLPAPSYCITSHRIARLGLGVSNAGTFNYLYWGPDSRDCFTGDSVTLGEFPIGSGGYYLFGGALWIGAVAGQDTLVSTGADGWWRAGSEIHPDSIGLVYRSIIDPLSPAAHDAVSEEDYAAVMYDTCVSCAGSALDFLDHRLHRPLNIEITQQSYAWSYAQAFCEA